MCQYCPNKVLILIKNWTAICVYFKKVQLSEFTEGMNLEFKYPQTCMIFSLKYCMLRYPKALRFTILITQ